MTADSDLQELADNVNREYPPLGKAIWGLITSQPCDTVSMIASLSALAHVTALVLQEGINVDDGRKYFLTMLERALNEFSE